METTTWTVRASHVAEVPTLVHVVPSCSGTGTSAEQRTGQTAVAATTNGLATGFMSAVTRLDAVDGGKLPRPRVPSPV